MLSNMEAPAIVIGMKQLDAQPLFSTAKEPPRTQSIRAPQL
jgi:hypothetical protein